MVSLTTRSSSLPPVSAISGTATPLWFGAPERPLFAWVHAPAGNVARGGAILCAPLAREQDLARYTFRRLAEELSARGILTVRFDYDGTGDSAGADEDGGRVGAWQESIVQAAALARDCGAPAPVLVGMRAGALLAASIAGATGAPGLVAWDPCDSGRTLVREQHALQRLHFGATDVQPGEVEIPGFVLSAETAQDLGRLEPALLGSGVTRALVLLRPNDSIPDALAAELVDCDVELDDAIGQESLIEGAGPDQEIPLTAIDRIVNWVSESFGQMNSRVQVVPSTPITWASPGGGQLVERALHFGPSGLFGIETVDVHGPSGPTVFFLNSAYGSHVGPNRLWVILARRWAAAGLRCIRMDLSGIGDSPSRSGHPEHLVRAPVAFDDIADATGALCPEDPSDVVFVGLCSGGYQALEAAVALRARGVCVVNPVLRFSPPELEDGPVDARRRLCRPTTTTSRVARRLPDVGVLSGPRVQAWREVGFGRSFKAQDLWVDDLVSFGVDALCICGEEEARAIAFETSASKHPDGIDVRIVPELDHALLPAAQRAEVIDCLTEYVLGHFAVASDDRSASQLTAGGTRA